MTAVTLTIPAGVTSERVQAELTVIGAGSTFTLPITNPESTFQNLEGNWTQVDRPGRKPILVRAASKLTTLELKVTVAAPDGSPHDTGGTVEYILGQLAFAANIDSLTQPIAFTWGLFDSGPYATATGRWHIDSMEIDTQLRQPGTNNISRALVDLTLIEASDPPSPATNGVGPSWMSPPAAPAPSYTSTGGAAQTAWVVQAGDTAYSIAAAVYGNPEPGWRLILTANSIVASDIVPGLTLSIPAAP